jgi:hypothetical protein
MATSCLPAGTAIRATSVPLPLAGSISITPTGSLASSVLTPRHRHRRPDDWKDPPALDDDEDDESDDELDELEEPASVGPAQAPRRRHRDSAPKATAKPATRPTRNSS